VVSADQGGQNEQPDLAGGGATIMAGPRLGAGFTDVPVRAIPIRWRTTKAMPMARWAAVCSSAGNTHVAGT